ncbi:uncharacterized protein AB675_8579 [Cyphellophora attinorum]|uniref:Exportin-5 C-terminal domain-containing protein n=1 Tax=Cyphellophora attinorum TaxID=1664694 RepID=A0A0N1P3N1_9EURO|nr:uncharacterized protein AB675_8579 [Phialophora attinorum]KPI44323.1 hypothetical protein AB675_8579 [Phialophora attinorum]
MQGSGGQVPSDYSTSNVLQALELIHTPTTKNETRKEASKYLDGLRSSEHALQRGLELAAEQSQQPLVRHFGLSLLEYAVKHQSHEFDDARNDQLRACIIDLGRNISNDDPVFIRNKISELWVELAKRSWALDWHDLDFLLCEFWEQTYIYKSFVLAVLENLSEDLFVREDPTAVLRGSDLNTALVEIYTPRSSYDGGIRIGNTVHHMRHGDEGWLVRITKFLESSLGKTTHEAEEKITISKAIMTLRSAFGWIMASAIEEAGCLLVVCNCLVKNDEDIIMAAVDALIALYNRQSLQDGEIRSLVYPLCQPGSVSILRQVYEWSVVGFEEVISQQYAISKKMAELISLLSDLLTKIAPPEMSSLDVSSFLDFLISIAKHDSLIVSIAAMHSWDRLLSMKSWRRTDVVSNCVPALLDVVLPRLIQYDQMPDDTEEPAVLFVTEEIEIFPERQGFFLNYRRLCGSIIEWICYVHLEQAVDFILTQLNNNMSSIKQADAGLDFSTYKRITPLQLRAESQCSIAEAMLRGLDRYMSGHSTAAEEHRATGERGLDKCRTWLLSVLLELRFNDPSVTQRQIKLAVEVSNKALQSDKAFALGVMELILSAFTPTRPEFPAYSDAVVDLYGFSIQELRRLVVSHTEYFATFYDQLSSKFGELVGRIQFEPRIRTDMNSILFLIVQRTPSADIEQQRDRLWSFLEPVFAAWNSTATQNAVSSFEHYCHSQGFDQIGSFLSAANAAHIEDWTTVSTSQEGQRLQQEMGDAFASLPLRETRVLLSASTDRLEQNSVTHRIIGDLWTPLISQILHGVLQIMSFNHRLHDPSAWPNMPPDLGPVVRRLMRDRYWQSGISEGSMNEFHSKVKNTKTTLEGFASSVRGKVRTNLEQCYSIVHTLGRLGERFYSMPQIPESIAEAMLSTTGPLSPHHFSTLLLMLPKLIEECPPENRQHFLTPILASLLHQITSKLSSEWDKIDHRKQNAQEGENLNDEMREDSVLRQTTYKAVNMVSLWLSPRRELQLSVKKSIDTKATQTMIITAQRLVAAFATDYPLPIETTAPVREYISEEMLKAAITAVNDGYFADYQQYYAQLVAMIWLSYGLPSHIPAANGQPAYERPALTQTPRNVLMSLPNMSEEKVDAVAAALVKEGLNAKPRKLRSIVMHLLEGVRGVRISDLGKIDTRAQQSRILEKYKQRESLSMQGVEERARDDGGGVDLGGVADMFGAA